MIGKAAAVALGWFGLVRLTEQWGALPHEIDAPMPGDDLIANPGLHATRAIDLEASPDLVFPWLVQMGPRRAGWYSYDWIDNLGRPSAGTINPEWQSLGSGDSLGSVGRIEFMIAERRDPAVFVIRLPEASPIAFTMAYVLRRQAQGSRLVVRVRAGGPSWVAPLLRFVLGPGDFVMLRRQLMGLRERTSNGPYRKASVERQSPG